MIFLFRFGFLAIDLFEPSSASYFLVALLDSIFLSEAVKEVILEFFWLPWVFWGNWDSLFRYGESKINLFSSDRFVMYELFFFTCKKERVVPVEILWSFP